MNMTMRQVVVLAVTTVACGDRGSLGNYDEGTDEASGGSSTGDDAASASMSSSASASASSSASANGETTDTDPTMSTSASPTMTGGETDGPICETDGNCTVYPAPCGDACGSLESEFDEAGCLRQKCSNDDACTEGERCFVALEFGLCESSGTFCSDDLESESCSCGGDADCNGGHCVPVDLFPAEVAGPVGTSLVAPACAPDDGVGFVLWIFAEADEATCGEIPQQPLLELVFYDGGAKGPYEFGPTSGQGHGTLNVDGEEEVFSATVDITVGANTASGSYEIRLGGYESPIRVFTGDFDGEACAGDLPCG